MMMFSLSLQLLPTGLEATPVVSHKVSASQTMPLFLDVAYGMKTWLRGQIHRMFRVPVVRYVALAFVR